jgi:uncharacterized iron-regulated protein
MAFRIARAIAVCLCLLGGTAAAAGASDWDAWVKSVGGGHVLAGKVFAVGAEGLTELHSDGTLPALPEGLVLLGEVHDNPHHHRVRAWLIAAAARARPPGARPGVVFEQIDADQQSALDEFQARPVAPSASGAADDLFRLLQWEKSGWPPAELYRPLFEVAIAAGLPIRAGSPPRERVRAVARAGVAQVEPAERARLRLDAALPAPLAEALKRELVDSHCGALPPQAIGGMAAAQRYRDAYLADALIGAAAPRGSAILIAGNGHVRSDRGVPWHIRERAPATPVTSVLLIEVEEGKTDAAEYLPRDPQGRPAAALAIFTPRAERADPCERFLKKG